MMQPQRNPSDTRRIPELEKALQAAHQEILDLQRRIEELEWIETALRDRTRALAERVKELDCLYAIADGLGHPAASLDTILQDIANAIPAGFQYPARTGVALTVRNRAFFSTHYRESPHAQTYPLQLRGEHIGDLHVVLLSPPDATRDPVFLPDELKLLRAVAKWVGEIVQHRSAASAAPPAHVTHSPFALLSRWAHHAQPPSRNDPQ